MSSCESGSPNCHFTCPFGGSWHICRDPPYFVGCCSSDPCTNSTASGCPPENLYSAIFDQDLFDELTPNNCIGDSPDKWFTCNFTFQAFLGCCRTNPCANAVGCPFGDVLPAAWNPEGSTRMYDLFLDTDANVTENETGAKLKTETSFSHLSSGAIVGITVGGVAGLFFLIFGAFVFRSRRRKAAVEEEKPFLGHYAEYVLRPARKQ
ncbi:hypothetical protein BDW71DRAFT_192694 [Aspergillus fruticulosus]